MRTVLRILSRLGRSAPVSLPPFPTGGEVTPQPTPQPEPESALHRFSRAELEYACLEAHMCGRVYATTGEKRTPGDEYRYMIGRALRTVERHRREKNRDARRRAREHHQTGAAQ